MVAIFHFSSESQPMPVDPARVGQAAAFRRVWSSGRFVFRALRGEGPGWAAGFVAATVVTLAYGASDEWHQSFVPLRDANVRDWFADMLGGAIGAAIERL